MNTPGRGHIWGWSKPHLAGSREASLPLKAYEDFTLHIQEKFSTEATIVDRLVKNPHAVLVEEKPWVESVSWDVWEGAVTVQEGNRKRTPLAEGATAGLQPWGRGKPSLGLKFPTVLFLAPLAGQGSLSSPGLPKTSHPISELERTIRSSIPFSCSWIGGQVQGLQTVLWLPQSQT